MRVARFVLLFLTFVAIPTALLAQQAAQPVQRDPQAVVILQAATVAMGGTAPTDSVATGSVVVVAGSKTDTGSVRILTRGTDQTAELIQTSDGGRALIYSRGQAAERDGTSLKRQALELSASSQSPTFPLLLIVGALNSPDTAYQYVGIDDVQAASTHHIRFWSTFASNTDLQDLAEFTVKDLWVSAVNGLPLKVAYERRNGRGAADRVRMEVFYSDYRNVGGLLYPFRIEKHFNGTPWQTITIQSVVFNTGLTDADFPVGKGAL